MGEQVDGIGSRCWLSSPGSRARFRAQSQWAGPTRSPKASGRICVSVRKHTHTVGSVRGVDSSRHVCSGPRPTGQHSVPFLVPCSRCFLCLYGCDACPTCVATLTFKPAVVGASHDIPHTCIFRSFLTGCCKSQPGECRKLIWPMVSELR